MKNDWKFSIALGSARIDMLTSAPPFEEIARSIAAQMRIQCCHPDPFDDADGFKRLVACLMVERPLFDLFFNSYNGYRGWYYRSAADGLRRNAALVELLAPQLIEFQTHDVMSVDWALNSLLAPSAKCWLAEVGRGLCTRCEGDWSTPKDDSAEILNGRWDVTEMTNSRFGRKAPYLEKLRVIGGFMSRSGEHYVARRKDNRAQEIHDVGWS